MNERERDAYDRYCKSTMLDIYDAYEKPSYAKVKAFKKCKQLCEE